MFFERFCLGKKNTGKAGNIKFKKLIWSNNGMVFLLPPIIFGVGAFFLIRLRAFFITNPREIFSDLRKEIKKPGSLSSLMLALAGTLGVGNVVGVAVGISVGGAGSVFWLLVSSIFSSVLKYCEVTLSYEIGEGGGMMKVAEGSFGNIGKHIGKIYAAICLLLSLSMGAALQARSTAECALGVLELEPKTFVIPLVLLIIFIASGGAKKIEKAVAIIIPTATIIYISLCLSVILPNISNLPCVINDIIKSAFNHDSAKGGILGFFSSVAIKEGFARGMLSNEAGAGTSSLAHARSKKREARVSGLFGMLEVFFDTVVLCPLTAFLILLSGASEGGGFGLELVIYALTGGAPISYILLFLSIFFFAVSTVLCWYYYGEYCSSYLFGNRFSPLFLILFTLFSVGGLFLPSAYLIPLCDGLLVPLTVITCSALIKNQRLIKKLSLPYIIKTPRRKKIHRGDNENIKEV